VEGVANLNAGSCSPQSALVLEAKIALEREMAADPVQTIWRTLPVKIEAARRELAAFVGAESRDLLLAVNASAALNAVLQSLPLTAGDELLTSSQEYYHYLPILRRLQEERGVVVVTANLPLGDKAAGAKSDGVQVDTATLVDAFAKRTTPKTKAMLVSHVTCQTGMVLPAKELAAMARERGILSVVDGAHALALVDLDLDAIDADFYAANCHKWLMGAIGSALLRVAPRSRAKIRPLVVMGGYFYESGAADELAHAGGPTRWQYSHEYHGTRDLTAWAVLPEVLRLRERLGGNAAVRERMLSLAVKGREVAREAGLVAAGPAPGPHATGMVAFHVPTKTGRIDFGKAVAHFRDRHRVEVALPALNDGTPLLRLSHAWFNHEGDLSQLAKALQATRWDELT
jgi:isopenicillin-N epimerase